MTEHPPRTEAESATLASGIAFALGAYGLWGLLPVYLKGVETVPAPEVLAHRVIWAVVMLAGVLTAFGGWASVGRVLADWRAIRWLLITAVLIALNWGVFIWAVGEGRILECSLGYFINPLVSVLLAMVFLKERLRLGEGLAVGFAALGVGYEVIQFGALPWVSLVLACSFGTYGLLRKMAPVGPVDGLFTETLLMTPLAIGYLAWRATEGAGSFLAGDVGMDVLLVLAGPVTAVPLLLFVAAARRVRLTTIGLLQYLAPTGHFLLAILAYGEPFSVDRLVTFALVWLGLLIYSARALGWKRTG